jgi:hypothetical protein
MQCWSLITAVICRQAAVSSNGCVRMGILQTCHFFCLQSYLEEMAAMLLQAQGNGDSPAGLRLQRLCTELVGHIIVHNEVCGLIWFLPANSKEKCCSSHVHASDCIDHGHGSDADARPNDQGAAPLHAADVAASVDAAGAARQQLLAPRHGRGPCLVVHADCARESHCSLRMLLPVRLF